jgi:hypothetical protein
MKSKSIASIKKKLLTLVTFLSKGEIQDKNKSIRFSANVAKSSA